MALTVQELGFDDTVDYGSVSLAVWGEGEEIPVAAFGNAEQVAMGAVPGVRHVAVRRGAAPAQDYPEVAVDSFDQVTCFGGGDRDANVAIFTDLEAQRSPNPRAGVRAHFRVPTRAGGGVVIRPGQACTFGGARTFCRAGACPASNERILGGR